MKIEDFQKLLNKSTVNTKHVRGFSKKWNSGVHRIPDEIVSNIGCIVLLLDDKVNNGHFCKKDEYLMIYNFQPLYITNTTYLCSLDMLIRPISKINDLETCEGKPLQLVVDGQNRMIVDNTYAMIEMGLFEDSEEEVLPICYGNYLDYLEPKASYFKDKLTALKSVNLAYSDMSREKKSDNESEELTSDNSKHWAGFTIAFDSSKQSGVTSPVPSSLSSASSSTSLSSDSSLSSASPPSSNPANSPIAMADLPLSDTISEKFSFNCCIT